MATIVGYYENTEDGKAFEEGPFVVVPLPYTGDCRIEVQSEGHVCPILPDTSIYVEMKRMASIGRGEEERMLVVCDALNGMVKNGEIICDEHGVWVVKEDGDGTP